MSTIFLNIDKLVNYAVDKNFITDYDTIYAKNKIYEFLGVTPENLTIKSNEVPTNIGNLLTEFTEWAYQNNKVESTKSPYSDLFETALMGLLVPLPSAVNQNFWAQYALSPQHATTYFYEFSKDTDYIKVNNVAKNIEWTQDSDYGLMEITINLSKPEKDPKAIAAALNEPATDYPPCVLCRENVGFSGSLKRAARQTHRTVNFELAGESWFMQYSPYVYYNEHAIVIKSEHTPMLVSKQTFIRLFDFLDLFPHYFIGSNAGLPIVGGSLLSHDHYQGGNHHMPLDSAEVFERFDTFGEDVTLEWLNWPLTVLRLTAKDREKLQDAVMKLVNVWNDFSDETIDILARTDAAHNAITPIARKVEGCYQIDIVLRNNRTNATHPDGIFHPHKDVHPVKKENIGLIEVLGHAILPGRLVGVIEDLKDAVDKGVEADNLPETYADFKRIYQTMRENIAKYETTEECVKKTLGDVFIKGLSDAGVIKQDTNGIKAMHNLIAQI